MYFYDIPVIVDDKIIIAVVETVRLHKPFSKNLLQLQSYDSVDRSLDLLLELVTLLSWLPVITAFEF